MVTDVRPRSDGSLPGVAVLGLGRMGSRLAVTLLRQGFATGVWNRSAGRASRIEAAGAGNWSVSGVTLTADAGERGQAFAALIGRPGVGG